MREIEVHREEWIVIRRDCRDRKNETSIADTLRAWKRGARRDHAGGGGKEGFVN